MARYDKTSKFYPSGYGDDKIKFADSKLISVEQIEVNICSLIITVQLSLDLPTKVSKRKLAHYKHFGYLLVENQQVYKAPNEALVFGDSCSLFPFLRENTKVREGDPNADAFEIMHFGDRCILSNQ